MKITNCHKRDIFREILITFSMIKAFKFSCACNTFGLVYCEITHISSKVTGIYKIQLLR